jgi:putative Mn2+ efflux pump MntP
VCTVDGKQAGKQHEGHDQDGLQRLLAKLACPRSLRYDGPVPLKVAALVLPLSLDTFAVTAAMGVAGLDVRARLRLSLIFAAFEMTMPLLGFVIGAAVQNHVGDAAEYVAVAVLGSVGLVMLRDRGDVDIDDLRRRRGWRAIALGLSVSVDELAIGLAIGLVGLPVVVVALLIGAQAFVAAQLGSRLGARLSAAVPELAARLAGFLLVLLAATLLGLRLSGHGG